MDTVPKFVQLIKLVQSEVGMGNSRVRPPLLELAGSELEEARSTIKDVLRNRAGRDGESLSRVAHLPNS
jgi:4-hydroxy-tetrahydrodipicolinate synthase